MNDLHGSIDFIWMLVVILLAARVGGELMLRLKQPPVLGELLMGILIGPSALHLVDPRSETLQLLAELGAVLLLFLIGLELNIEDLLRNLGPAMWVAAFGIVFPFLFGYLIGIALLMAQGGEKLTLQAVFLGATLTATSVGITARVLSDLNFLHAREARIILGAAVVDDILGLLILAVVSGFATIGSVSVLGLLQIGALALLFLIGSVLVGFLATPWVLQLARRMRTSGAIATAAVLFCFVMAALAGLAHLAPIVGAFAAGLVLERSEERVHFEQRIQALAEFLIPIFFVLMGATADLGVFNPFTPKGRGLLLIGGLTTLVAVLGKLLGGVTIPMKRVRRWLLGVGMVPRGEVGLIFASLGLSLKVLSQELYTTLVFMVMLTTLITPPWLRWLLRGRKT